MVDGLNNNCKECAKEYANKRKHKIKKYQREYYLANVETISKNLRQGHLKRKYGVTQEWYDEQLKLQNNGCKICGAEDPGKPFKFFHVDHDHKTGRLRGLLCRSCNTGIGLFKEDVKLIEKAIEYVNKHRED
jgi:hypothetical protein